MTMPCINRFRYIEMDQPNLHTNCVNLFIGDNSLLTTSEQASLYLSPQEIARANKIKFNKRRESYLIAHSFLKRIAGNHLKVEPSSLEIKRNHQDKPFIETGDIHFSISYSQHVFGIAFQFGKPVGLDIEDSITFQKEDWMPEFLLNKDDIESYHRLTNQAQFDALLNYWTSTEAVLKATGTGFSGNEKPHYLNNSLSNELTSCELSGQLYHLHHLKTKKHFAASVATAIKNNPVYISNLNSQHL